jgi:uncharacterized membrane protein YcaP (DUF421 family)
MEPNGQLSVLKKPLKDSVTKEDLNLQPEFGKYLPTALVTEGKLQKDALKEYDLTEDWLQNRLKQVNVKNMKDVYFAQLMEDGELFVVKKEAPPS